MDNVLKIYHIVFMNILALFRPLYWIFIMCLNLSCIYYQVNKYYVDSKAFFDGALSKSQMDLFIYPTVISIKLH